MPEENTLIPTPQTSALSVQSSAVLEQVIDGVFSEPTPDLSLGRIQSQLDGLASQSSEIQPVLEQVLGAMGQFFFGFKEMQNQGFLAARDHFTQAATGFNDTQQIQLRDLAAGLAMYSTAIVEFQASNVGRGVQLFKEMREYLNKAGKFGQTYRQLIDQLQPENLFAQAVQKLVADRDFVTAKVLVEQASEAAEKVAHTYFPPGTAPHIIFLGSAHYYKAHYTVVRAFTDFGLCKYDSLAAEIDLKAEAVKAHEYLSQAADENQIVRSLMYISQGHTELLQLLPELAALMLKVLNSNAGPESDVFSPLRQRIRRANEVFAKAGPAAGILTRFCDDLFAQLGNIERLAKPVPKLLRDGAPSVREAVALESFQQFQNVALASLQDPLAQFSRWSILTLIFVGASVGLVLLGAGSALLGYTKVGLVSSVSSLVSGIVSALLFSQLRKTETGVKESRKDLLKLFGQASDRFFAKADNSRR
jgi:hypothetical protein